MQLKAVFALACCAAGPDSVSGRTSQVGWKIVPTTVLAGLALATGGTEGRLLAAAATTKRAEASVAAADDEASASTTDGSPKGKATRTSFPNPCLSLAKGDWTLAFENTDDGEILTSIGFPFNFRGIPHTSLVVGNNGYLRFADDLGNYDYLDVFDTDVDTRGGYGQVWTRQISGTNNKYAVAWDRVGYFNQKHDKLNTFQVLISDGKDESMGIGNNVCFCYADMQWTTGDQTGGVNGFGGQPVGVGISGSGNVYSLMGSFNQTGKGVDGVDRLDGQSICFDAATDGNIPPIPIGFPSNNLLELQCGETVKNMVLSFAAPETRQTVSVSVTGAGARGGPTVLIRESVASIATATINWTPTAASRVTLTFTASRRLPLHL